MDLEDRGVLSRPGDDPLFLDRFKIDTGVGLDRLKSILNRFGIDSG